MSRDAAREFTPGPLPEGVTRLRPGECIGNSVETAVEHWPDLDYAEGLAKSSLGYWYKHAWNVAEDGTVADTTWREPGLRYVGRVVPLREVTRQAQDRRAYWYMDEQSFPWVPEGEAGIGCWTESQWEWVQGQLSDAG